MEWKGKGDTDNARSAAVSVFAARLVVRMVDHSVTTIYRFAPEFVGSRSHVSSKVHPIL